MPPLTILLQSTPVPIPILPTAFPTPPPPSATLVAEQVFWDVDRWLPAISAARTLWYLEYIEQFMYFFVFIALILIALRIFGFAAAGVQAQRQRNALSDVEQALAEQNGGVQATSDQVERYISEQERIRTEISRDAARRDNLARRAFRIRG